MEEQAWNAAALAQPVLAPAARLWRYERPAVVLGPSQRADAELERRAREARVAVIARITGGGAVLTGPWLVGASVVLPPEHPLVRPSLRESYRWLGELFAAWLGAGAVAVAAPPPRPDPELAWACFAGVSHWEVAVDGRKIVGLSQARRRNGVLLSAGVLVGVTPWSLLCAIMGRPEAQAEELARRTVSTAELGLSPSVDALASALAMHAS